MYFETLIDPFCFLYVHAFMDDLDDLDDLDTLMVLIRVFMMVQLHYAHTKNVSSRAHRAALVHLIFLFSRFSLFSLFGLGFNGELLRLVPSLAPQVVHARFEPLGPRVKVHGRERRVVRVLHP
jgi:hypothetical protein